VTDNEFATKHTRVYHVSEAGSWPSIQRHGLLSVGALLDLFEVTGPEREELMTARRANSVTLSHPQHGRAVVRDQKPVSEAKLADCLLDMTPAEWLRLLNSRVFFWLDPQRLDELLAAKKYRERSHEVLTFDTASLLSAHGHHASLSPINSGSTLYKPAARGTITFRSIALYDILERRAPVELTIESGVADARDHVVRVEERRGAELVRVLK
jgi:hypothetical protein